ncbi:Uncharacterized protein PCOAH_00006990 [Plasmodium coatneyi]|uniref:Uncharacterized protein n=1 Tax=Plasmodium coatneyi TaxID=208452 RepID=A0A1B1DU90_9APIC|nr:Uncharacterized protein PCOAH_00006990 [Plasmodium coatneyi]ANQ06322.1 Uncharacterized protein PCOAH_00006990 [Plasmodium coatneyi]
MSLEFGSGEALQIKCSYMIEKYKKKLQKVKQLKRELKASLEKKRKEIYMDRYFLNKEKEHLYSELAKEKEKIETEHLEKTKELYNSYFADIFLYEQEYYQCIYKVFKNLLLKKEEIDEKERRVLKLQEYAWMTLSDRNVGERENTHSKKNANANANVNARVENKTGSADRAPINQPEEADHSRDDKHFDIENLCDLNINEIYQSIILDQGERPHNLSNKSDEFSESIMGQIQGGTNSPPFLDEQYQFGSEHCSSVSGTEKSGTFKEHQFLELSSRGRKDTHTEELRNPLEGEDDQPYVEDVLCEHDVIDWDDAAEDDHSGGGKMSTHREEDKESTLSKSGGTEQYEEMREEGEVGLRGSIHFADQKEEIKCLTNEETSKGEKHYPNEYHPNSNDEYITRDHLEAAECMSGEEVDGQNRRSAIDANPLSNAVEEELRNNDIIQNRSVANPQKENAELDQVIENNIDFNISSYFSGSYEDIADCEVLALNDDAADEPEYEMIEERLSGADLEELGDSPEKNHGNEGDTQYGEICTVEDPTKQTNPNKQIDHVMQTNQISAIINEEEPSQGINPFPFNENVHNFYNEYEHMRRFNEDNDKIQSSIFKTLYSYHNEYSIPIEKMQTFENYVEEIGQLENYEHILSFINGGGEDQPGADCNNHPNGNSHDMAKQPVDIKVNSNLGLHTVKELINYVSSTAKGNDNEKSGFKKKHRK